MDKKNYLELIKYNASLSLILFISTSFYFQSFAPDYFNFNAFTISELSYFLNNEKLKYFNLMFFIKALLDLSFAYYLKKFFKLKFFSVEFFSLFIAILSFGLLGFFPSSKNKPIHMFFVIILFLSFTLFQFLISKLTKNQNFVKITKFFILIQVIISGLFVLTNNINGIFEIIYMIIIFFWLSIFIRKFLK